MRPLGLAWPDCGQRANRRRKPGRTIPQAFHQIGRRLNASSKGTPKTPPDCWRSVERLQTYLQTPSREAVEAEESTV